MIYKVRLIFAFCITFNIYSSRCQNDFGELNDLSRIAITSYIPGDIEGLNPQTENLLITKMNQITSEQGMSGNLWNPRFIISPSVSILNKEVLATAPPMVSLNLYISLFIGDGIEGVLFSSETLEVKGVGTNESKAYLAAIKKLNPSSKSIQAFLDDAKIKIIQYYNTNCDFILKEAQVLESQYKYAEALLKLTSIPKVCKDCYDKGMDSAMLIFQNQIDYECEQNLAQANNIWNSGQDLIVAKEAVEHLNKIDPNASCFEDAKKLSESITKRVNELDQRNWDFVLKTQDDSVNTENSRIEAAKAVGAAYGNNQPQNINYNTPWLNRDSR